MGEIIERICRVQRWRTLIALALLAITLAGLFELPSTGAASPRASAAATRPSHAERRAITLSSLTATTDPSLGLLVTATFKGDIEHRLGQGNLINALVALILDPDSSAQQASGLMDTGGGFSQVGFPRLEQHSKVGTGRFAAFGRERVMRFSASGAAVIRQHDRVIFYAPDVRSSTLSKIRVKVFAAAPGGSATRTWRKVLADRPTAQASLNVQQASCAELSPLHGQLGQIAKGLSSELQHERRARGLLHVDTDRFGRLAHLITKSTLAADLRASAASIAHLKAEMASLAGASARALEGAKRCSAIGPASPPPPDVHVVQTDPSLSQQMAAQQSLTRSSTPPQGVPVIDVNDQAQYQRFGGLGAAMTDSSAWLIYEQLSAADRQSLMQELFSSAGIHLNFLRVPMAASDFTVTSQPYSYDDMPSGQSDPSLSQFSIAHDLPYIIPTLKQALAINPALEIQANPWSPPAWMKSNDSMDNDNAQGSLLSSAYAPLANYFVKFIQAYQSNGIPIDAITPENEPRSGGAGTSYPGLTLPEPDEATFISQYLKPALDSAGLSPKIYGHDLSWNDSAYASALANGPAASDLTGIAWHCYFGLPSTMSDLHQSAPGLDQIANECSPEIRNFHAPEYLISALRNWASVVTVWNVALDPQGGPKEPANGCPGCTGVVTIDEQSHSVTPTNEYYQMGQVSSFVQPGATRIDSPNFVSYSLNSSGIETVSSGLDDVAFQNPDGSKVLIANNNSSAPTTFAVHSDGSYFTYTIPPQAMTTFTWP